MTLENYFIGHAEHDRGETLFIHAGNRGTERIVPPAGEDYAFERTVWARTVQISVSPKGKSVRVFVDGEEVVA